MFDPFYMPWLLFCCLWMSIHVAMAIWYALWLIRKVRMVENAVVWRKTVAGRVAGKLCRTASDRPYPDPIVRLLHDMTLLYELLHFEGHEPEDRDSIRWRDHDPTRTSVTPRRSLEHHEPWTDEGTRPDPIREARHDPYQMSITIRSEPEDILRAKPRSLDARHGLRTKWRLIRRRPKHEMQR